MKRITTAILMTAALGFTAPVHAGNITIKGSDTLVILAQKWAERYMSTQPETKIQVTGGGSGIGFAALQNGQTDIANASRPIKPAERAACIRAFNANPREYKVALDGLSIYVHSSNPVSELSIEQLEQIFTGKIRNWKEVGGSDLPVTVISRENSSGTYEFFKEHVLKGKDFVSSAQTMPGTAAVLKSVTDEPKAIGYGGAAYGHDAKVLKIKATADSPAVEPTEENVVSQKYPIWRYLYNYLDPAKDKDEVAAYLKWIRSDEGQKVVKEVGYYPLPKDLREK
ncbi:MAG TPA: phosphate ABC transporter substrate-binding protein [Verrucomicrobiota bacterium]|nr:phosphate ABC transporter substrate-binding protein [Verrucomicrobiota bacterium]HPU55181.1 phosphate ABC transporter substrate-binding protein [Verrucomicrobiota bacterium]